MAAPMLHVVALSGGKDSTALALRLQEVEPRDYAYLCTPTGDELPEMVEHWKRLGELLGKPLTPVTSGHSLSGLIRHYDALPNWRQRWCTRQLKIEPCLEWLMERAPATLYVGLRADEPERQGGTYDEVPGVKLRYPLREWKWTIKEVWSYLDERGVEIPERTDCARCFFQTLPEWWKLWKDRPAVYTDAEQQEAATGHTFRSPGRDTWPASLSELRERFEAGEVPGGANQGELFKETRCRVCSL